METHDERPVVVGVDASDSARAAADWAGDLAAVWGAPLHLLHSVPADAPVRAASPAWLRELADKAESAGAGASRADVVPGDTIELLTDRADRARMLVLGSYGEGASSGMLAGAVALALAGTVPCPVAVVRGVAPRVAPPRTGPVVVGVDGSATAHAAALLAADIAASMGAPLVAVHAWSDLAETESGLRRMHDDWAQLAEQGGAALAEEVRAVSEVRPALDVRPDLVRDTPLRALLRRAQDARMLVVGHRGGRVAEGMGLGSTSRALVEFAPCPVVVTPPVPAPVVPATHTTDPAR
ncbi:universal stress protein [Pseudonocardia hierapolitana]|uniref:universal stress protein n=1 Tax=Pseudonocardia hierapolitana TaxID=1128676 RepID=UPI0014792FB9|nr:universal stress protein [Pseudonocardia hierapolitana]